MASESDVFQAWKHGANLVGVPTEMLAGIAFNDGSMALHISGVREMFHSLFEMLDQAESPEEAAMAFQTYLAAIFGLDIEQREKPSDARRFRSSYLRLLRGWAYDSNSREGAVLKGWVESRFGLFPTYHHEPLRRYSAPSWMNYVAEKMSSRFHNNSIQVQLDLLYEYCQWAIRRFGPDGQRTITLYRGVNDFSEHVLMGRLDGRNAVVRLNNLNSFTSDREVAGAFGDLIMTARVPVAKILFFPKLFPNHSLKTEAEYLVIGGDYRVTCTYE